VALKQPFRRDVLNALGLLRLADSLRRHAIRHVDEPVTCARCGPVNVRSVGGTVGGARQPDHTWCRVRELPLSEPSAPRQLEAVRSRMGSSIIRAVWRVTDLLLRLIALCPSVQAAARHVLAASPRRYTSHDLERAGTRASPLFRRGRARCARATR